MSRPIIFIIVNLFLVSCTGVKYLASHEKFYAGSTIKLDDNDHSKNQKKIVTDLYEVIEKKPNETILGMRPAVSLYGMMGEPKKEKSLRGLIKNRIGTPAVLYNSAMNQSNMSLIENRLFNSGFFQGKVTSSTHESKHKVTTLYNVELNDPFRIDTLILPNDLSDISHEIKSIANESLVKIGIPYNLETLKKERLRINEHLKNEGFYFFNPEFIQFEADSSWDHHSVSLTLRLTEQLTPESTKRFWIDKVTVFPNYHLNKDSLIKMSKVESIDSILFKDPQMKFRNEIFGSLVKLRPKEIYEISNHSLTLKRLSELNIFKFTNIRFTQSQDSLISADLFLTPLKTISLKLEGSATSKSNNFVGPGISIDFKNRNLFRGAEELSTKISGAFETQINNTGQNLNSYEYGFETVITFPRLISPIAIKTSPNSQIPKTSIKISNSSLHRAGYYQLNKSQANFGYSWHRNNQVFHNLNLLDLNYIFLAETSSEFDEILANNSSLEESFTNQFIFGGNYSFTYSNQVKNSNQDYLYFNTNIDLSGNIIDLINQNLASKDDEEYRELFGLPYAQYVRFDFDFRYFFNFSKGQTLASRLILGLGIPYGNSQHLPYTKQFFSGGSSSIRAFPARGVGPGSYISNDETSSFFDQSGDIKLEGSVEYRANIYKALKGAFFIDAGNIWLLNDDEDIAEGVFDSETFYEQIALGTGVGLRIDLSYFVLRIDWAFPLKKPYVPESAGWVVKGINFGSKSWRQDNLILNIAIGYPF